jgi:hypothetical protein
MAAMQRLQGMQGMQGMARGGAVEDTEGDSPRVKAKRQRMWGDVGKPAEDLPPVVEKKAKGGVVRRRPAGKKKPVNSERLPVPMVTDEDMDVPPPPAPAVAAGSAPLPPGPPPGMNKGGKCEGMAAGGVAKLRRGFPNVNKKPAAKRMAKGGSVRGCGVAQRGKKFSGIY